MKYSFLLSSAPKMSPKVQIQTLIALHSEWFNTWRFVLRAAKSKDIVTLRPSAPHYNSFQHRSFFNGYHQALITLRTVQIECRFMNKFLLFARDRFESKMRLLTRQRKRRRLVLIGQSAPSMSLRCRLYAGCALSSEYHCY